MKENPVKKLETLGQSIWLNHLGYDMFTSGELRRLIAEDGLRGITSNPSILEKVITESHMYDKDIRELALRKKDLIVIYETLIQCDVQNAADEFRSVYEKTNGKDGYVSLEVNPHLAYDTSRTIEEARRIWASVDRPNIFIKVPATAEGLPAIQQLISEGINVNATLLFGLTRYKQVTEAYLNGLKTRIDNGKPVKHVASVASFFLSRIDSVIDPIEKDFLASGGDEAHFATNIKGQVAISTAKIAYTIYKEIFESEQFAKLAHQGAIPQRLVWASTGTRDEDYSNIKYIEAIIGENTINLISPGTLDAYRKYGKPALHMEDDLKQAQWVMSEMTELGIDMDSITEKLENDSVKKFIKSFDKLLETLAKKSLV